MSSNESLKEMVREKYGDIATQSKDSTESSCCGTGSSCGCSDANFSVMAEDYKNMPGYEPNADLSLGCGLPTEFAQIKPGDTVVDLGSGAGNDCFIARAIAGDKGRVIGIDMTEPMLKKARANAAKLGFTNVEFRYGDIENMPVEDNTADVVVSNCVMNLVPDKVKAFTETFRIMKPGGHFSISDIVLQGSIPPMLQQQAELYAGCVSGATQRDEYLETVKAAGFLNMAVQKERKIEIPNDVLASLLTLEELRAFKKSRVGIFSITVYAEKPASA